MKKSEAFRIARARIELDWLDFICNALPYNETGDACRTLVMQRLEGACTYGIWLRRNHRDWWDAHEILAPGRLAWLDSLVAEWEAKGD